MQALNQTRADAPLWQETMGPLPVTTQTLDLFHLPAKGSIEETSQTSHGAYHYTSFPARLAGYKMSICMKLAGLVLFYNPPRVEEAFSFFWRDGGSQKTNPVGIYQLFHSKETEDGIRDSSHLSMLATG